MLTMEVTKLIERCRQGDKDALGELYKAYAQRMRGVCWRYFSDKQTVEDVLHDAFVIIFTSFDKLRDVERAEAALKHSAEIFDSIGNVEMANRSLALIDSEKL